MNQNINKYLFKSGLKHELELVDIADLYTSAKQIITLPHRVGFYVILFIESGSGIHFVDFNPVELKPDTVLFLHKDIVQQFGRASNLQGKAILFTDTFFSGTEQDMKFLGSTLLFNSLIEVTQFQDTDEAKFFIAIFNEMKEELKNAKDASQKQILKNLLHNLLLLSERKIKNNQFNSLSSIELDYVILFKNYLENNFSQKRNVSFYTEKILLTEKRLNQATKKILGKTPKEIIDDRILLEAKRLLVNSSINIKEIAFALGFEEPTYFAQYFKKHTLITPAEFREKYALAQNLH